MRLVVSRILRNSGIAETAQRTVVANFVPGNFGLFRRNPCQSLVEPCGSAEPRLQNTGLGSRIRIIRPGYLKVTSIEVKLGLSFKSASLPTTFCTQIIQMPATNKPLPVYRRFCYGQSQRNERFLSF